MDTKQTMEYMAACLVVAQEEMNREETWKRWERNGGRRPESARMPNKALIQDNLRNVARMAFRLARRV